MADCTETDQMADAYVRAERARADLLDQIREKREDIMSHQATSDYSNGLCNGWADALLWVMRRL